MSPGVPMKFPLDSNCKKIIRDEREATITVVYFEPKPAEQL
jgi:hypothetical protein